MPKRDRPHAAAGSARPDTDDLFNPTLARPKASWNKTAEARAVATFLDGTPEMRELQDLAQVHAKRCALCDAAATQFGVYTPSVEEFLRWRVANFAFGLCDTCFVHPDSPSRLKKRFDQLVALQHLGDQGARA